MRTIINEPIETMDLCFVKGFAFNNENNCLEIRNHSGDFYIKPFNDPKKGLADYHKLVSRFAEGKY